jgi:hypothetical protein
VTQPSAAATLAAFTASVADRVVSTKPKADAELQVRHNNPIIAQPPASIRRRLCQSRVARTSARNFKTSMAELAAPKTAFSAGVTPRLTANDTLAATVTTQMAATAL